MIQAKIPRIFVQSLCLKMAPSSSIFLERLACVRLALLSLSPGFSRTIRLFAVKTSASFSPAYCVMGYRFYEPRASEVVLCLVHGVVESVARSVVLYLRNVMSLLLHQR